MARMLGDAVFPESVQNTRRKIRNRVSDLREPIRRRRQDLVPGPDVVGRVESSLTNLRDRFVSRETVVERIRSRRQGSGSGGGSSGSNGSQSSSGDSTMV